MYQSTEQTAYASIRSAYRTHLIQGVGKLRLSWPPILIFVSEYNKAFSNFIWEWGCQWNHRHRQCRHAGLQLDNLTFSVVTQEPENLVGPKSTSDGTMGLAQSNLSSQHVPTVVESLADRGLIQDMITSNKLSRHADQERR